MYTVKSTKHYCKIEDGLGDVLGNRTSNLALHFFGETLLASFFQDFQHPGAVAEW